ncbi:type II secretion system F family protein [Rosistilla oblonga]|uniref:type II secretion system F family protein n=1 Tax=Rosistilla oblonga TaxID=2527990 RepID=UPI003A970AF1
MTSVLIPASGLIAAIAGLAIYWVHAARRESILHRLSAADAVVRPAVVSEAPFARRHRLIPWGIAIPIGIALGWLGNWPWNIAVGIAIIISFIASEADAWIYQWRLARIESQLADAIDVLVASVSAGASLQAALQQASEYTPRPLRDEITEMVARLRLGDAPPDVFDLLRQRVPTETFRLFSMTLTVNWQVGGALAETLSAIGGTIRDRLEIARQIRTLGTQGTLTTLTVLAVVWLMAAMMWQADPPRFLGFIHSTVGSWLVAVSLFLQGVGVALVSRISRPKI